MKPKNKPNPKPAYALGLTVKKSKIDGKGCFTTQPFKKGRKIAEYVGERISRREIKRRLENLQRIQICAIDSYWAIDGAVGGNGTQFVNHSCAPNCFVKIVKGHVLFYALRDIAAGEELLLDYEYSWHGDDYQCQCGALTCRGKLNK
jgi:SET domain-containing protein